MGRRRQLASTEIQTCWEPAFAAAALLCPLLSQKGGNGQRGSRRRVAIFSSCKLLFIFFRTFPTSSFPLFPFSCWGLHRLPSSGRRVFLTVGPRSRRLFLPSTSRGGGFSRVNFFRNIFRKERNKIPAIPSLLLCAGDIRVCFELVRRCTPLTSGTALPICAAHCQPHVQSRVYPLALQGDGK